MKRSTGTKKSSPWLEFFKNPLNLLLLAFPATLALKLAGANPLLVFIGSALAIIPLAGIMGTATESLAGKLGPAIGGLMNATFGNAAELIIAVMALSKGPQ